MDSKKIVTDVKKSGARSSPSVASQSPRRQNKLQEKNNIPLWKRFPKGKRNPPQNASKKSNNFGFKKSWLWKYIPILVMIIAMSLAWLKATPEGRKVEIAVQKNTEEIKMEMEAWLDQQIHLYEESLRTIPDRITQSIFETLEADSPAQIGWHLDTPENAHTKNRTHHYWDFYNSGIPTADLMPHELRNDIFVYVPGLFTQWYPGYMGDLVNGMASLHYETYFCKLNTANSMKHNALVVAEVIRNLTRDQPDRKVVLMGHSKGALDAATAFVKYPDIVPKISAFIAFQAPWGGSAIANDILSAHHRRAVSSAFIEKVLNGDSRSLTSLMYTERQKFVKKYPFPLGAVPTISVASYETSFKSLLKASIHYVQLRYKEPSDGCVATKDAIIPGTILVELPNLDHFGPAYHGFPACCNNHDPIRVQMALLNVLLHN